MNNFDISRNRAREIARIAKREGTAEFEVVGYSGTISYDSDGYKITIGDDTEETVSSIDKVYGVLRGFAQDHEDGDVEAEEVVVVEEPAPKAKKSSKKGGKKAKKSSSKADKEAEEKAAALAEANALVEAPYETDDVKVATRQVTVGQLIERIEEGDINLSPPYQRNEGVWSPLARRRSLLIESLMLGIPIPSICFEEDQHGTWMPVDGLQRLSALKAFVLDGMPLRGLEYLKSHEKKTFDQLPRVLRRKITESQVACTLIEHGTPVDVTVLVFQRFNTGSTACNAQEVRNAVMRGHGLDMINAVAASTSFENATGGSIKPKRMADRELVLRAASFIMFTPDEYNGKLQSHLTRTLEDLNRMEKSQSNTIEMDLIMGLDRSVEIFGEKAFRKLTADDEKRQPLNKALFEVQVSELGLLLPEKYDKIVESRKSFVEAFRKLCTTDEAFDDSLTSGTGHKEATLKRHTAFNDLIDSFL